MDLILDFRAAWADATWLQTLAPTVVLSTVALLCVLYLIRYLLPSLRLSRRIKRLTRALQAPKKADAGQRRAQVAQVFSQHPWARQWHDYVHTLHDQRALNDGEMVVVRTRSTSSAAQYFTLQAMVDTPLRTEFYRHLPGLLTAIGIVGTFFGLMIGLQHFDPSSPEQVTQSVDQLLKDVFFAFLGSFVSILASIVVTLTEKWRLGRCYKAVEELVDTLDSAFDAGVGEEYLAELVRSTAESAVQTRQLKDSLVTDLREMLQNLVDTQVRENLKMVDAMSTSARDSNRLLADHVVGAIESSLKGPLESMAGAMKATSADQSGQVHTLLQDVLVAFMSKLESSFGQQFNGLHDMMNHSVASMRAMQEAFGGLVQDLRQAGESSAQSHAAAVDQLIKDVQASQTATQAQMTDMLAHLQTAVARFGSEGEAAGKRMGESLETMFVQFEQARMRMDAAAGDAQAALHESTRVALGGFEAQTKSLLDSVGAQQQASEQLLSNVQAQTSQQLQNVSATAERLQATAERFDRAGVALSGAGESTAQAMTAVQRVGTSLSSAAQELGDVVADYRGNRDALGTTLTALTNLADRQRAEESVRAQFMQSLEKHGAQLRELNDEAADYLDGVGDVLGKGFDEFKDGMERSLAKTMGALDQELHKAITGLAGGVDQMRDSIEDLGDVLDRVPARA